MFPLGASLHSLACFLTVKCQAAGEPDRWEAGPVRVREHHVCPDRVHPGPAGRGDPHRQLPLRARRARDADGALRRPRRQGQPQPARRGDPLRHLDGLLLVTPASPALLLLSSCPRMTPRPAPEYKICCPGIGSLWRVGHLDLACIARVSQARDVGCVLGMRNVIAAVPSLAFECEGMCLLVCSAAEVCKGLLSGASRCRGASSTLATRRPGISLWMWMWPAGCLVGWQQGAV